MVEPLTVNRNFTVANTGDLVASWGTAALNPNFVAIDGILGGMVTLSLAAASTITLTAPSGSVTPSPGPFQQQNACIKLTGTLTGNNVLQFTMPGFWIVDNQCTVGSFYVSAAASSGGGNVIGIPPGKKSQIFFDGTSMDFVNAPDPGTAYDLHGVTSPPAWMTACTVQPYLIKDGTIYSAATYPALAAVLGSSFGGNGITTFGVPDERNRARIALDTNGPGSYSLRVTSATSGIDGKVMGASGGDQQMQSHTHTNTLTDPGHRHQVPSGSAGGATPSFIQTGGSQTSTTGTATTGITLSIGTTGGGGSQNMQPTIVSFLPLIKT